ncbi:MAG TPA: lanthionine synthetase LanC family protein [Longimicrobium sp.]|nr:lanthionine synthetase LanC family protein [Longimicrobium sp.]
MTPDLPTAEGNPDASPTGRDSAWLEAAAALGARLCRDAVWDGARCNWLGDSSEFVGQAWTVVHKAMGAELYDGTAGIALFLAHLHALTGEPPFRTAAEGALRHVLSRRAHIGQHAPIAFHAGKSGVAWVLAEVGDLLASEEYAAAARELADEVAAAEPDPQLVDVISGSAGAIPALLGFADRWGDGFQAAAVRHGEHLLHIARPGPAGTSWRTLEMDAQDLTGYSHGAAGVALALLELAVRTGEARFRAVAEDGFRYERSHFSPRYGNWPDFRNMSGTGYGAHANEPSYAMAWCHGAPGIGLSRVRAWRLTGDDVYRQEAEVALRTTAHSIQATAQTGSTGFSLCHGDAGNAELFLLAEEAFGGGQYRALAEEVGARGVTWYLRQRAPWPCGIPDGGETPNLMLGLAGIGYFYLRLHDPAAVPSILLVTPRDKPSASS